MSEQLFTKTMAQDVIEDYLKEVQNLEDLNVAHAMGCGMARGLIGAFHMVGLINTQEWANYLKRVPKVKP